MIKLKSGDVETVSFSYDGHPYSISESQWSAPSDRDEGPYADLCLRECEVEVFGISCTLEFKDSVSTYTCLSVSAFKKQGDWAKMLLDLHGRLQVARNKRRTDFKYFGASEIKAKFEE